MNVRILSQIKLLQLSLYEILILVFPLRENISKPMKYEKQRMYLVNTPISCGLSIYFLLFLARKEGITSIVPTDA
jgi:hypothetical protein